MKQNLLIGSFVIFVFIVFAISNNNEYIQEVQVNSSDIYNSSLAENIHILSDGSVNWCDKDEQCFHSYFFEDNNNELFEKNLKNLNVLLNDINISDIRIKLNEKTNKYGAIESNLYYRRSGVIYQFIPIDEKNEKKIDN